MTKKKRFKISGMTLEETRQTPKFLMQAFGPSLYNRCLTPMLRLRKELSDSLASESSSFEHEDFSKK